MNIDFASSNRAIVRRLSPGEAIVAQNGSGDTSIMIAPAIRGVTVNISNEGKGDLYIQHCSDQITVAAGTAMDMNVVAGGLEDPNAKPEPAIEKQPSAPSIAVEEVAVEAKPLTPREARLQAATVKSDVVVPVKRAPVQRGPAVFMSQGPIKKRA